ncbi:MAG TPA: hypothetical protein VK705_07660 [Ferruginibacter sp.]|jgi:hypothetical protein|nr:hypothetical protein [Ferruginibacter sp.]
MKTVIRYTYLNKFFSTLIFLTVLHIHSAYGQTVLTVTEHDEDGKYLGSNGKPKSNYINSNIVDINSTLEINLNKDYLFTQINKNNEFKLSDSAALLLKTLTTAMAGQTALLEKFNAILKNYNPLDHSKDSIFTDGMKEIAKQLRPLYADQVIKKYIGALGPEYGRIAPFFIAAQKRIEDIQNSALTSNPDSQPIIQLGAWSNTGQNQTPLHLNGFDSIAQQEYFTVQRWQIMPTPAQLDELKQLQQVADSNKDVSLEVNKNSLQTYTRSLIDQEDKLINDSLKDVSSEIQSIRGTLTNTGIPQKIDRLKNDFMILVDTLNIKIEYYQNLPATANQSAETFDQLISDLSEINTQISSLKKESSDIIISIDSLQGTLLSQTENLKALLQSKVNNLFTTSINSNLLSSLNEGYKLDLSTLQFTDKVNKLSFDDLPQNTELDLHTTGNRKEGDQIIFKLRVLVNNKVRYSEAKVINMYAVLLHVQGTVGIIFAHPISQTALQHNFQLVPYYNLLFKGVWPFGERYRRRSVINDKFWDLSWGIHFSSPDFDKDDIPEIGAGVVVSGIKDYVQVGFANDLFLNKWYWFFGVRFPLPFLNSGGGSGVQSQ